MTTLLLAGLAAAAAALVAVPGAARAAAPGARTSLSPQTHLFGAPVTATLEVRGARREQVTVRASFTPYIVVRRAAAEGAEGVVYTYELECLARECLPPAGSERVIAFPAVEVRVAGAGTARLEWPAVQVASRLSPRDAAAGRLRAASDAPPPWYRVDPALLGWALAGLAGLLVLAAVALGVRWWLPARTAGRSAGARHPTSLDYALTLVSVTAGAGEEQRREALDSLAVVLEEHGRPDLARRARILAWSRRAPTGDAARQIAHEARAGVGAER